MFVAFNEVLSIGGAIYYTGPIMFALVNVVLEVSKKQFGGGEGRRRRKKGPPSVGLSKYLSTNLK